MEEFRIFFLVCEFSSENTLSHKHTLVCIPIWSACTCCAVHFSHSPPCICTRQAPPDRSCILQVALSREVHTHRWPWSNLSRSVMAILVQEPGPREPTHVCPGILLIGHAAPGLYLSPGSAGRCISLQTVWDMHCRYQLRCLFCRKAVEWNIGSAWTFSGPRAQAISSAAKQQTLSKFYLSAGGHIGKWLPRPQWGSWPMAPHLKWFIVYWSTPVQKLVPLSKNAQ